MLFEHLFQPFELKGHTLPNRVAWIAHLTDFAYDFAVSDAHIAYYEERAKHGVGLIIMGTETVSPTHVNGARVSAFDPANVESYKRLSEAIKRHDTVLIGQLTEDGSQNLADLTLDWDYEYSASAVADWAVGRTPKVMEQTDIDRSISVWLQCIANHQAGGLDGTELKVGHDGLPRQFLSPYYNQRTDEYGGSRENRMRFLRELLTAVRRQVGDDYLLGIRYVLHEFAPGGYELDEGIAMLVEIERWGLVDYVVSDLGVHTALKYCNPPMATAPGFAREAFAKAHAALDSLPLVGYGRIKTPELADQILAEDEADLVGVARALLVDPLWIEKAQTDRGDDIRMCIGCNQGCLDRVWKGQPMTCIINPAAGRERKWGLGTLEPAARTKEVVVVGAGPAGLKAAEVAALRGHSVTLIERSSNVGGQVNSIVKVPVRRDFHDSTAWIETQIEALEVPIRRGWQVEEEITEVLPDGRFELGLRAVARPASPGSVDTIYADEVVIATGSVLNAPEVPGVDGPEVYQVEEALDGKIPDGARVVIADAEGTYSSTATAEFLADLGHEVTLVTAHLDIGMHIGPPGRQVLIPALFERGVEVIPNHSLAAIDLPNVKFVSNLGGHEREIVADAVVLTTGRLPDDSLYRSLAAAGANGNLHRAGDCLAPRDVGMAIYTAEEIGRSL